MTTAATAHDLGLVDSRSPQALADIHSLIAAADHVALSVETDTRHGYRPRLALVSLAITRPAREDRDAIALVALDPLPAERERPDPGPLDAVWRVLAQAPILVHGGEHTLSLLRRQLGLRFPRVTDTQQAAALLGLPRTGLRALVGDLLGVTLPPVRSVDWSARPLPDEDLAAALADVAHLPALALLLRARIAALDLGDELEVASQLVEDPPVPPLSRVDNLPDPKRYRHFQGASRLTPEGLRVLAALASWRDQKARELDLPPLAIFSNAQLVELAMTPEQSLARLSQVRFHSRLVHADQQSLRLALTSALARHDDAPAHGPTPRRSRPESLYAPDRPPPRPRKGSRPDDATRERLSQLKAFRREEAERRGVTPFAVLPAVALEHLAFFPETPLADVPGLGRRRIERYGAALSALCSDTTAR